MTHRSHSLLCLVLSWLVLWLSAGSSACGADAEPAAGAKDSAEGIAFFEKRIRPLLIRHCYECHSAEADDVGGGLRLDSRAALLRGGDSGAALVPGKPQASLLLEAVRYESYEMPPEYKLKDQEIRYLEDWIRRGAPDPRVDTADAAAAESRSSEGLDLAAGRSFWAFTPPARSAPPDVNDTDWPRGVVDRFVLSRLEDAGLQPSSEAARRTLVRRLYLDVLGLPPTPEQTAAFVDDPAPDAYERLVDRVLASPRYGERWARVWMDVMRFAEDQAHIVGSNSSLFYPNAWLYRDWLIQALNDDIGYDRFLKLQLAADLMEAEGESDLAALGFVGLGPKYYRRNSPEVMADEWEDRVDTLTRGVLGVTVACARCHDHKYDPISMRDYYALAGVFASTEMFNRPLDEERETDDDGEAKSPDDAMHIIRDGEPQDLNVFLRGNVENKGPVVQRRFLEVLCPGEPEPFAGQGSGRLQLAEEIIRRDNPLTARVIVNRIWGELLGQPLVGTPSNFGQLGERPTHPELLDDLAVRFMDAGWSWKWLQRELLLSATYRQASDFRETAYRTDPSNRLLWRMNRRRLSVEAWRDALLAVTGTLSQQIGGRSAEADDPDNHRRTVYSSISRLQTNSMLVLFDFPDPNAHSEGRAETTTPLQKLFVLNSPFLVQRAEELLQRLESETPLTPDKIADAYRLLYSRLPTDAEFAIAQNYLESRGSDSRQAWQDYLQILLAANEFLYVD